MIYRRVEKESDELSYMVWSLVMVRKHQLLAQEVNAKIYTVKNKTRLG